MFERYSEPARRAIFYSRYMAHNSGSPEIETEHLLLGLLRADMGLARRFFGSPWAAEKVWQEIERTKPVRAIAPGTRDIPLSDTAKRVLLLAVEEADQFPSEKIRTEHLLLGQLRDEKCLAAVLLEEHGLDLDSTREELKKHPHDDSTIEKFVREPGPLPQDVVELQARVRSIVGRMEEAIANRDFTEARSCSDEERIERDKLRLIYQKHGLSGWMFE
jgi:ATP-dependent Clp protease ATP-binding subunit ClpC